MNTIQISNFFNKNQGENQEYEKNIPYAKYMVELMCRNIRNPLGEVLEIGAGQGRFTIPLAEHSKDVVATDIADYAIALLQKRIETNKIKNVKAIVQDATALRHFPIDKHFDSIIGFLVLHHIPISSYKDIAKSFSRLANKKSQVCFIEPNCLCPIYLLAMAVRPDMPWRMEKGTYTNFLGQFIASLKSEKFTIVKVINVGFIPPQLLNKVPQLQSVNYIVERIPLVSRVLCPFTLLVAEKSG